jgi:hypothetical protein
MNVKMDVDGLKKHLNHLEKKQIPFAASVAINATAKRTKDGLDGSTKQHMDRPSPFSRKPTLFTKSSKRNLSAHVYVKARQLDYLQYIIEGKSESGSQVPTGARLNKFGSIGRNYVKTKSSKPNFFSGVPRGGDRPAGLYQRLGGKRSRKLKQHVVYKSSIRHRKVWPFHKIGQKIVDRHFKREMDKALAYAIRTAK